MTCLGSAMRLSFWAAVLISLAAPVRAETFPSRPIHLIMPYAPGGIVDFAGRVVAQKLGEVWDKRLWLRIVRAPVALSGSNMSRIRRRTATTL